jgi:hypothetical protein
MTDPDTSLDLESLLSEVRQHLERAQELMDSINPDSIFGARVQLLLDELSDQTLRDIQRSKSSDSID